MLIGIPYHPAKHYALDHLFNWIDAQDHEVLLRMDHGQYGRPGAVKEQLEFFRLQAIAKRSSLLIVEADTIPPLDAIPKLSAHNKDVVGALYRYRSPDAPIVAWPKASITEGLCEVEGMGTGCVLLSLKALKSFSFFDWDVLDADWPMYETLRLNGFKIYLDTDLVCKHYDDYDSFH